MRSTPRDAAAPRALPPRPPAAPDVGAEPERALSRGLHWLAWGAALVSASVLVAWRWGPAGPVAPASLVWADVALSIFFLFEFFTRTGWRRSGTVYLRWRWFDVVALVPVTLLGPVAVAPVAVDPA